MKKDKKINWPKSTFTIDNLQELNPEFVNITLRVKLRELLDKYEIEEIGSIPNGKGRPKKLFVKHPVTEKHIEEAKLKNANINYSVNITVASVNDKINREIILNNNKNLSRKGGSLNKSIILNKNVIDVLDGNY